MGRQSRLTAASAAIAEARKAQLGLPNDTGSGSRKCACPPLAPTQTSGSRSSSSASFVGAGSVDSATSRSPRSSAASSSTVIPDVSVMCTRGQARSKRWSTGGMFGSTTSWGTPTRISPS